MDFFEWSNKIHTVEFFIKEQRAHLRLVHYRVVRATAPKMQIKRRCTLPALGGTYVHEQIHSTTRIFAWNKMDFFELSNKIHPIEFFIKEQRTPSVGALPSRARLESIMKIGSPIYFL